MTPVKSTAVEMSAAISTGTEEKNSGVENATRLHLLENTEKHTSSVKNTAQFIAVCRRAKA
jgi:hypothetical protein